MSMTFPYCNLTTDLQNAFQDIEKFDPRNKVDDWTATTGQSNTYQYEQSGYIGMVTEDGVELTSQTSIADVENSAGSFYYDETANILYLHTTGSDAPSNYTIEIANMSWDDLLAYAQNQAFQELESMVDSKYPRPLPFARDNYNDNNYDSDIVKCAALLTCSNIISTRDPNNNLAKKLYERVWNPQEEAGIMYEYKAGIRSFSFETTADEFDGNIKRLVKSTGSTGLIRLKGSGNNSDREVLFVEITTAGKAETAEYKYSYDHESTWVTDQEAYINYTHIMDGIYLKFSGDFKVDDKWRIDLIGQEKLTNPNVKSIRLKN